MTDETDSIYAEIYRPFLTTFEERLEQLIHTQLGELVELDAPAVHKIAIGGFMAEVLAYSSGSTAGLCAGEVNAHYTDQLIARCENKVQIGFDQGKASAEYLSEINLADDKESSLKDE